MESPFPVATSFEVKYGEPPRHIQIIRQEKFFSLFRLRHFWVIMALMKAHQTGQLNEPGLYTVIVFSATKYKVYKGEEFTPDSGRWEEIP